ncbi:hypothetical protein C8F04DRAFT_996362 [Mycena alexandri]|uniref:Uncharacterized protein n=1 Tax=Mycena alexandri TaxID=1745969 RepID=A0AAD6X923_9AGAR|nr:hypothetical protein C8F04DRAFT_996362 [Mycena alexandri]
MSEKGVSDDPETKCRIAEIAQYSCVPKKNRFGQWFVNCVPIPRLFRICPDRPAVEVTRFLKIDLATGYVEMPKALEEKLPNGKAWRDVVKISDTTGSSEDVKF